MYQEIIDFWFNKLTPAQWWIKDSKVDNQIVQRFGEIHKSATLGELWQWRESTFGSLAEIILLDQFSRNIYRNNAAAFAYDGMALILSQIAINKNLDQQLSLQEKSFLYMPFMHSESAKIHEKAVVLFKSLGLESSLDFELKHKAIIDRFGRYPHRNHVLNRQSTTEELEFLKEENSSF
ncbi:MAG: DUF924 family protein [Neisseriaceae bacterium]